MARNVRVGGENYDVSIEEEYREALIESIKILTKVLKRLRGEVNG